MDPALTEIEKIIENSLREDIGRGDMTSNLTIPADTTASFTINARQELVACGVDIAAMVFAKVNPDIKVNRLKSDGDKISAREAILSGEGNARAVFAAERVALNLLAQMCSVATITGAMVKKLEGTKAKLLDTRKTIPGLRVLQKYAVSVGGGYNHRFALDDGILIKDNHIAVCGSITAAINSVRKNSPYFLRVEVECDTLEQVKEAVGAGADIIMLDNMALEQMKQAVLIADGKIPVEASGNVTISNIEDIARTGVDFISSGMITAYPPPVDIGLDIVIKPLAKNKSRL